MKLIMPALSIVLVVALMRVLHSAATCDAGYAMLNTVGGRACLSLGN